MKDLRYLLIIIAIIAFAHATKRSSQEKTQAKFLPDIPDAKEQRHIDSSRIEAVNTGSSVAISYD